VGLRCAICLAEHANSIYDKVHKLGRCAKRAGMRAYMYAYFHVCVRACTCDERPLLMAAHLVYRAPKPNVDSAVSSE